MGPKEIESKVVDCVAASLVKDKNQISTKTTIIAELGADSLDFMDIIFQLESAFDVRLQKEDFDFILRTGLPREEAVVDGNLSQGAKQRLKKWLPELPVEQVLLPKDLARYVSIESITLVIQEKLQK